MSCVPVYGTYDLGPFVMTIQKACDLWVVPHLMVPFLATIFTRSAWFGFFIAGIGELVEYFAGTAFGNFVIFVGTANGGDINHDNENFAGSYIEDWLIQGGIGSLVLGWIFYSYFTYPALLRWEDLWNGKHKRLIIYSIILFGLCIVLPGSLMGVKVDTFPLGTMLAPIIQCTSLALMRIWEVSPWGKPYSLWMATDELMQFYLVTSFLLVLYYFQNAGNWFFSSGAQTWLITGILLVFWIPLSQIKWKWFQRIDVTL